MFIHSYPFTPYAPVSHREQNTGIVNSLINKTTGPSSIPLKLLLLISDLIIIPLCHNKRLSLYW